MAEFQPPEGLQVDPDGVPVAKAGQERSEEQRVQEHKFDIAKEEQRERGWYLAWHCRHQDCDSRGDLTVPSRGRAYELLALLDDGHRELTDG